MFQLASLLRKNILNLKPYTSARDEYKGKEGIFLDANENSFGSVTQELHNRYPDPLQWEVKHLIAEIKGVKSSQILLGNGSDEPIDLVYRCFANPGKDSVLLTPPTYGMYEVSANINDIAIIKVSLTPDFELDTEAILSSITSNTKAIFLCSPNNPTGNSLKTESVETIISKFDGIVVVDEAYIDFSSQTSFISKLNTYPNLIVLQTFSKAWGMANLRVGMAFASEEIISIFNKVKPPYNINGVSQKLALDALQQVSKKDAFVQQIIKEREILCTELLKMQFVEKIYPSDANFLLVKTSNGKKIYDYLIEKKVIVRDRSNVTLCEGCLRISVGKPEENKTLLHILADFK